MTKTYQESAPEVAILTATQLEPVRNTIISDHNKVYDAGSYDAIQGKESDIPPFDELMRGYMVCAQNVLSDLGRDAEPTTVPSFWSQLTFAEKLQLTNTYMECALWHPHSPFVELTVNSLFPAQTAVGKDLSEWRSVGLVLARGTTQFAEVPTLAQKYYDGINGGQGHLASRAFVYNLALLASKGGFTSIDDMREMLGRYQEETGAEGVFPALKLYPLAEKAYATISENFPDLIKKLSQYRPIQDYFQVVTMMNGYESMSFDPTRILYSTEEQKAIVETKLTELAVKAAQASGLVKQEDLDAFGKLLRVEVTGKLTASQIRDNNSLTELRINLGNNVESVVGMVEEILHVIDYFYRDKQGESAFNYHANEIFATEHEKDMMPLLEDLAKEVLSTIPAISELPAGWVSLIHTSLEQRELFFWVHKVLQTLIERETYDHLGDEVTPDTPFITSAHLDESYSLLMNSPALNSVFETVQHYYAGALGIPVNATPMLRAYQQLYGFFPNYIAAYFVSFGVKLFGKKTTDLSPEELEHLLKAAINKLVTAT